MARKATTKKKRTAATRQARLRDVAERAGVHLSTVSRVLNPGTRDMVSEEVAQRIQKIAREMGYRTNAFGYGLKTQRSTTIGVVVPDLTNPVFPPIIRAIEHKLRHDGYTAILGDSDSDPEQERVIIDKMMGRRVEGLILATAHLTDDVIEKIIAEDAPVVLINRATEKAGVISVTTDDLKGAKLAVDHVIDLGHKAVAHVAGPQSLSTGHDRYEGFVNAMRVRGLTVDKALIHFCKNYSEEEGRAAMAALLDSGKPFTAVVAANDLLALGCYAVLAERGVKCPDDISVTGYNDMPFTDKFNPPLTTIRVDLHHMGERAAEALLSIIRDPDVRVKPIKLPPQLIVRGSTAPPSN